jgi:hypothetical protein
MTATPGVDASQDMPTSAHAQRMKPAVHMSPRRGNVSVPNRAAIQQMSPARCGIVLELAWFREIQAFRAHRQLPKHCSNF